MKQAIGATCRIKWVKSKNHTDTHPFTRYFSFGQHTEDADTDEFGVPDHDIFYYCFECEDELRGLMEQGDYDEFTVLDYELVYKD